MPVRVPALERDIRPFLVALHDGDAVRIDPGQQRPHLIRRRNPEPGVQERRGRLDVLGRVQREVEPIRVADDNRAILVLLCRGRVEAEKAE